MRHRETYLRMLTERRLTLPQSYCSGMTQTHWSQTATKRQRKTEEEEQEVKKSAVIGVLAVAAHHPFTPTSLSLSLSLEHRVFTSNLEAPTDRRPSPSKFPPLALWQTCDQGDMTRQYGPSITYSKNIFKNYFKNL